MRRSGTTTKQMLAAKQDAVFVWVINELSYPINLAAKHGRTDLHIVGISWLLDRRYLGGTYTDIVIDHELANRAAYQLADRIIEALTRVR